MGRTKTKVIDDSQPVEKIQKPARKLGRQDELVERLKAELAKEESPTEQAKPELPEAISTVERTSKPVSEKDSGAKQTHRSKKYQAISKDLDKTKTYPLTQAVELTKKISYTKQVGTLEAHINTISTNIRGLVSLPFVSGKKLKILAFGKEAQESGADVVGTDEIIDDLGKGKANFDLVITTPDWMPKLAKVARILGPKGLMPNPKNGTITTDLKKTIEGFQAGKTEYKTESKAPIIHLSLGKLSQPTEELSTNIRVLLQTLGKSRVKKVSLSPTMGPSVKLDLSSL